MKRYFIHGCTLGVLIVLAFPVFFTLGSMNGDDTWFDLIKRLFGFEDATSPSYVLAFLNGMRIAAIVFILVMGILFAGGRFIYAHFKKATTM